MMRLPKMDYIAPDSIEDALSLLDQHKGRACILAGGTDLLPSCKLRNIRPPLVISLRKISQLRGIRFQKAAGFRVGAMTTLFEVRNNLDIIQNHPGLAQAAASVGARQLQNMGTLGGNVCLNTRCTYYNQSEMWRRSWPMCLKMGGDICNVVPKGKRCYAVFSADTVPALISIDAQVKLSRSLGERVVPVKDLYTGDGKNPVSIQSDELVTEIIIPAADENQKSIYLKHRIREAIDFPLVAVAVRTNTNGNGILTKCKVIINAVDSAPVEVEEAEEILKGKKPTEELIDQVCEKAEKKSHPVANIIGVQPAYRRKMASILTKRAFKKLIN